MILIIVDLQVGLDDPRYGTRNNVRFEENVRHLLSTWRAASQPLFFSRHLSRQKGSSPEEHAAPSRIRSVAEPFPNEPVFTKQTNSIFKNGEFAAAISKCGRRELVFAGMTTDICITASARDALDLGYEVSIVGDACATFDRGLADHSFPAMVVHEVALASLAVSGVRVMATSEMAGTLAPLQPALPAV